MKLAELINQLNEIMKKEGGDLIAVNDDENEIQEVDSFSTSDGATFVGFYV